MAEKLTTYDPADDLQTDQAVTVFMEEAIKTDDEAYISHARSVVARARAEQPNR